MKPYLLTTLAIVALLSTEGRAAGQQAPGVPAATAAARAVLRTIPAGHATRIVAAEDTAFSRAVARALGFPLVGSIRAPAANTPVSLRVHRPVGAGDSRVVTVEVWYPTEMPRIPVAYKAVEVELTRSGNAWHVRQQRLREIS